ncbi:MAG: EAL domain-containing protein [Candidatus Thiodiazotropha sp. (ex Dulcina madagascariensis)]|nr:EAL domain-containing protein [Candidatus Thiodiazotropha sp. (ex Dulcina madagascariensis)]
MVERTIDQVKFANYFQLLRGIFSQTLGMSVFDQYGVILWEAACPQSDATTKISTYANKHPINCHTLAGGISRHPLATGEILHLCGLPVEGEKAGVTIALLMAATEYSQTPLALSMNDVLNAISKSIRNEIELQAALAASESELNAMADELTERYEELNLVYEADNSTLQSLQSQESLRHLVNSCTEFLNVGMTALIIPDKNITIYDFNDDDPTQTTANLIDNLRSDCYYGLQTHKQTIVINSIQDSVKYKVFCEIPQKLIITPVQTGEEEVIGMLIIINNNWKADFSNSDRNLLRVMSKKVSKVIQTTYDDLTGLINKHSFEYNLKDALSQAHAQGFIHALLNIDLDRLGVINDISGHEAGDKLLRMVAQTVCKMVRSRDIVARLGGDEFGVLLESCPMETAEMVAKNISKEIANLSFEWQDEKYDAGVCIGVVPITPESESVAMILSSSEMARNTAKERGRSQIVIYEQNDIDLLRRRNEIKWVTRIQSALRDGRFQLHSQLIEDFKAENDTHYEILLRMIDDKGKLVFPGQFIPAAEHYHLMPELDRWVIKTAIDYLLANINDQQSPPCKVAINLSGQSLCEEGFQEYLCHHVHRLGKHCRILCFEITESAAIANLQQAGELISTLKNEGCSFSLDDFGTGLSSFAYLQTLDVDFLKIDGSFVSKMVDDPVAKTMVSAINQVGQAMGLRTIAEYVENDAIIAQLKQIGVDYGQGFALAKPKPFQRQLQDLTDRSQAAVSCGGSK